MAEYIEKEKTVKVLRDVSTRTVGLYSVIICSVAKAIEKIPAADVRPVVLCRDCVNYGEMLSGYDHRLICHKFALTTKPDDFCSRGERRNCGAMMEES